MSIEDDIAFLEKIPALNLLGRSALRILAIGVDSRSVDGGEVLFFAGDEADSAYVVQEGSFGLRDYRADDNAEETTVRPGTLLGELAMITPTTWPVTATALEPSKVIRISRGLFMKMLEGYPDTARRMRDAWAARVDQCAREIESVKAGLQRKDGG